MKPVRAILRFFRGSSVKAALFRGSIAALLVLVTVWWLQNVNMERATRIHQVRVDTEGMILASQAFTELQQTLAENAAFRNPLERLVPPITASADVQEEILRAAADSLGPSPLLTLGASVPTRRGDKVESVMFSLAGTASPENISPLIDRLNRLPFLVRVTALAFAPEPPSGAGVVTLSGEFYVQPVE